MLEALARGLRAAGGVISPSVSQQLAQEGLQDQAAQKQLALMGLQRQFALEDQARQQKMLEASPQYQMQMESLKNDRSFRESVAGAAGDESKIYEAAMRFGKPELAASILKGKEDRAARIQAARDANETKLLQLEQTHELRMQGLKNDQERAAEIARHNRAIEGIKAQSSALGAELKSSMLQLKILQLQNQSDPAKKSPEYVAGLREVAKDDAAVSQVTQLESALKRWQELNKDVTTGRISGYRPGVGQPQFQELQQLENYLAVNNFKPGQGQISNFERQLIKGAGPSTKNDETTNERIINIQLGAVQNLRDRAAFREWYLEKNKKLLGADREWAEYIEANPRYTKGKDGAVVENTNRQSWDTYFKAGGVASNSGPKAGDVVDGYRFKGGNPADPKSWEKL